MVRLSKLLVRLLLVMTLRSSLILYHLLCSFRGCCAGALFQFAVELQFRLSLLCLSEALVGLRQKEVNAGFVLVCGNSLA